MLREHLFDKRAPADPLFRWRGGDVTRVEGLSDGVFAVTLTLLIVSMNVPSTFHELWIAVRDLPVFLVCFVLLMWVWHEHHSFFRRYGLQDTLTSVLNAAFLFLILFYAYPLKFLATFLWRLILGQPADEMFALPPEWVGEWTEVQQRTWMMVFYDLGIIGVFGLLLLMLGRAWSLREALELDELERVITRGSLRAHAISVALGALSLVLLLVAEQPGWAGLVFFLMGPLHGFNGYWTGAKARRMHAELTR